MDAEYKPFMIQIDRGMFGGNVFHRPEYLNFASMDECRAAYAEQVEKEKAECEKTPGRPITHLYMYDRTMPKKCLQEQVILHEIVEKDDSGKAYCHEYKQNVGPAIYTPKMDFPKPDKDSIFTHGCCSGPVNKHWGNRP